MRRAPWGPQPCTPCPSPLPGHCSQGSTTQRQKANATIPHAASGKFWKVRQLLESSPSMTPHALQRGQTLRVTQRFVILIRVEMASCPWCWTVPVLENQAAQLSAIDKQHQCHLGASQKCRLVVPIPDVQNQNLTLVQDTGDLCAHESTRHIALSQCFQAVGYIPFVSQEIKLAHWKQHF